MECQGSIGTGGPVGSTGNLGGLEGRAHHIPLSPPGRRAAPSLGIVPARMGDEAEAGMGYGLQF